MAFRIYTKTGDAGETALFGGRRVPKSHLQVDAYGTVDELNSFIGLLRDSVDRQADQELLAQIQNRLFSVGAHLASDLERSPSPPDLHPDDISILEQAMDSMDEQLPELKNFILPGGHPTASLCHICRTVCRRAERLVVALHQSGQVDEKVLQYLNRLSDFFFILARQVTYAAGVKETVWKPRASNSQE